MRVMVLVKANAQSEAGEMPDPGMLTEMGKFNEQLIDAGVMLAGDGLHPSSNAARVKFSGGGTPEVVDGPFAETKELVAGYWLWQVDSLADAIAWAKRCPDPAGQGGELELRPIFEADDFGDAAAPELRALQERLRAKNEQED